MGSERNERGAVSGRRVKGLPGGIAAQRLRNAVQQRVFGVEPAPVRIDRYMVLKPIGSGGMGVVYAAYDTDLDRKVAVKLLRVEGGSADVWRTRLRREAQALAKLSHPNVVQVYDVGEHDGQVFVSMEFIDGPNLREHCQGTKRRAVVDAYVQAGRGLAAAHAAGIVHRDFKPENVLVGKDGRVRVLDFGLARGRGDTSDLSGREHAPDTSGSAILLEPITRSGLVMGTPAYMAPEQHVGEATDERSDQFSFCVALYEQLYGERPFAGDTLAKLRGAVIAGAVRPASREASVPAWLRRVLLRGLATESGDRFEDVETLLAALLDDPAVRVRRVGFGALALGVVSIAGWQWQRREADNRARQAELRERATTERERAAVEQQRADAAESQLREQLRDRADALTLAEIDVVLPRDPTRALAMLSNLSPAAEAWLGEARVIAAAGDHLGVARSVVELPPGTTPHGLSPDGRWVVVRDPGSAAATLVDLVDASTRALDFELSPTFASLCRDGSLVAAKSSTGELRVWSAAQGHSRSLGTISAAHQSVSFTADAESLLTFGRDAQIHLWRVRDERPTIFGGHEDSVVAVQMTRDGSRLASVDGYGTVRRWNVSDASVERLEGSEPIAFGPDATLATTIGEGDVLLYPLEGESSTLVGTGAPLTALAISDDGRHAAAGDVEGRLIAWDLETGRALRLPGHPEEITQLRFADGGSLLTTTSLDNTLGVWALDTGWNRRLRGHDGVGFWAYDANADELVTVGWEGQARRWDLSDRDTGPATRLGGPARALAFAADDRLAIGAADGTVEVWDGRTWKTAVEHEAPISCLAYGHGDGLASSDTEGEIRWTAPGTPSHSLGKVEGEVVDLDASSDRRLVAAARLEEGISLHELGDDGRRVIPTSPYKVRWLGLSEDASEIVTVGWIRDGGFSVRTYAARTGAKTRQHDLPDVVTAAAISHAADEVIYATSRRGVHLVSVASGQTRHLGDHDRLVHAVALSPDGRTAASGGVDGHVRVWDVATGRGRDLELRQRNIRSLTFAADGRSFAVAGDEPRIHIGRDDLPTGAEALRDWLQEATDLRVDPAPLQRP